jgi:hypothetical protein
MEGQFEVESPARHRGDVQFAVRRSASDAAGAAGRRFCRARFLGAGAAGLG